MKKIILVVVFVGVVVGGYALVSRFKLDIGFLTGETAPVRRGDLIVPITASGYIKPASVTQIKSKASGEVITIPVELGDMVHKGDLLIELLDVDERRSLQRATSDHARAQIELENAQTRLKQAQTSQLNQATAKRQQAEAQAYSARSRWAWASAQTKPADPLGPFSQEEFDVYLSAFLNAEAAVAMAQADIEAAHINIELARQQIKVAEEAITSTTAALEDARERLRETRIVSPIDGMVLDKKVQVGEVVQSGKTMFTGGTVLMEIADVSEIYAVVNVDEADIGQVRDLAPVNFSGGETTADSQQGDSAEGDTASDTQPTKQLSTLPAGTIREGEGVKVGVESFPDEDFRGVITRISPQSEVQQAVATFKVWIKLNSGNVHKLRELLNTQAEARFTSRPVQNALLVKYDAIQQNPLGNDYGVYIPFTPPGATRPEPKFVACDFGASDGIEIEVRPPKDGKPGLAEGQAVYIKLPQKTQREQEAEEKDDG